MQIDKIVRKFLRLRRQQDVVKVITLYVCAACISVVYLAGHAYSYAKASRARVEYTLTGTGNAVTDQQLQAVQAIEGVEAASRTRTDSVTVSYQGGSASLEVQTVSRDYPEEVYGICADSATKIFYANAAAFTQIRQSLSEQEIAVSASEISVEYQSDEETAVASDETGIALTGQETGDSGNIASANFGKPAKIVQAEIGGEDPYICTTGDSAALSDAGDLRICVSRQDKSYEVLTEAEHQSFTNSDALTLVEAQAELDRRYQSVCFAAALAGICALSAYFLWKFGYKYSM